MKDKKEILKEELARLNRINDILEENIKKCQKFEDQYSQMYYGGYIELLKNNVLAMCEIAKTKELI